MPNVRTRFAPSPTGALHLGSARTALYAWLYAKKHHGQFILRVEDTDRTRSTLQATQTILEGLAWMGMHPDEGPFYQSERFDRYHAVIKQLLSDDKAYRCTCTPERLNQLREQQMQQKIKPRYDGHCRDRKIPDDTPNTVVRFRNPTDGAVTFDDAVYGAISVHNTELDDLIIARSDGSPTYNFTVVVDDWDMQISHVIRGDDHINNTPRQINILKAVGAHVPTYAHIPMILDETGKKLSKRHGAASILAYRDAGYLPEAFLNYLVRLGWSHGDQEIFTRDEMIQTFDLEHIGKSACAINPEKLNWLNQHYLKHLPAEKIEPLLAQHLQACRIDFTQGPELSAVIDIQKDRVKTVKEMAENSRYFFEAITTFDPDAIHKHFSDGTPDVFKLAQEKFSQLPDWSVEHLQACLKQIAADLDLKMGKVAAPIRIAVTGSTQSPAIAATLSVIGRKQVLARLQHAMTLLK